MGETWYSIETTYYHNGIQNVQSQIRKVRMMSLLPHHQSRDTYVRVHSDNGSENTRNVMIIIIVALSFL